MSTTRPSKLLATALLVTAGCDTTTPIAVFVAPSLAGAAGDMADLYRREHPQARVRLDIAGSQTTARKLTELNMRADLVMLADAALIDEMLVPEVARWSVRFATNSIVLAHLGHSRYTDEITEHNWAQVLSRPDVRLGLTDPNLAPIGYRTLMVWQLAAAHYAVPELAATLRQHVAPEHLMADEAALWALLSARAVDYAFLYRSTAEAHRLKITALPDAINLSQPALAADYSKAVVPVRLQRGETPATLHGAPLWFGLTVPTNAAQPQAGLDLAAFVLSEPSHGILRRAGFQPLVPAQASHTAELPPVLRALSRPR